MAKGNRERLAAEREKLLAKAAALEEQAREARARAFEIKRELAALVDAEAEPAPKKARKK